jgi:hypothetical protein
MHVRDRLGVQFELFEYGVGVLTHLRDGLHDLQGDRREEDLQRAHREPTARQRSRVSSCGWSKNSCTALIRALAGDLLPGWTSLSFPRRQQLPLRFVCPLRRLPKHPYLWARVCSTPRTA